MTHLDALRLRLSRERVRLQTATSPNARTMHAVRVAQSEREVAAELAFLGISDSTDTMSDDELMAALASVEV